MQATEPTEAERLTLVIRALRSTLNAEAALLDKWAADSVAGGWSTHQVEPMRRRADELRRITGQVRGV